MDNFVTFILVVLAILIVNELIKAKLNKMLKRNRKEETETVKIKKKINYQYKRKNLLTNNEYSFYMNIKDIIYDKGLHILTKVRLADLIDPVSQNRNDWYSMFARIKSKHIDFAVINDQMHVLLLLELDDRSHQREDRVKRDQFVDDALKMAGYNILHLYNNSTDIDKLKAEIGIMDSFLHL